MRSLTLFDLLARSWRRQAGITDICFSTDGAAAAFAALDGTVAISSVADSEPPEARIRVSGDLGQTTIRPREKPPAPLISTPQLGSGRVPVVAFGQSDFLVGSGAGEVLLLRSNGVLDGPVMRLPGPAVAIDHAVATGITMATDGDNILLARMGADPFLLARGPGTPVSTITLSPGGDYLAFAAGERLAVWITGDEIMPLDDFACKGRPVSIRWSGTAPWLACALETEGLGLIDLARGHAETVAGFPAPVRNVCWSRPADALVASGAFRIAAWRRDAPPFAGSTTGALETGRAGLVAVEAVAAHPSRTLVAAGYANGQIVVARIGGREELIVRSSGGAVSALAWSPDGNHLAVGDADGGAAIVTFPEHMFK